MAASIPDSKRPRLVQLLGMLGSDFDGERATAGRMADTLVRSLGLTWDAVITAPGGHTAPPGGQYRQPGGQHRRASDHSDAVTACLNSWHAWTQWELGFLHSIQRRRRLTEKQAAVLRQLCRRAEVDDDF
jgi:hypothetical protein